MLASSAFDLTLTDANLTAWRGGVDGGAGYSWPRNELVSVLCPLCTTPNVRPRLHSTLGAVDAIWTCSGLFPVHTPYIFSSCSLRTHFFVDLLPSSPSCCERKTVCCLTKSHGLETWRLFRRYNGLVIPRLSSPSIPLPFPSPYSPYNPLHLASWFILYSMVITPFAPEFRALFLVFQELSSLSALHCILFPLPS